MTGPGLPAALRPWAGALGLFDPATAPVLGGLVQRVSAALGPLRREARAGDGEPDGYAGLTRRGPPERLLLSEWLLADALPEEFLRRAAMGEQAFLAPRRENPAERREVVALFDAGPDQLGAPRVAQLAALIALTQRAEASSARLRWGIWQSPEDGLREGLSRQTVQAFLRARSTTGASQELVERWVALLQPLGSVEERWSVGGPALPGACARVLIDDDPEPGALDRVRLELRRPRRPARSLVLELPPEADTVRLLRDPFRERPARPDEAPTPRWTGLAFAPRGQRLFLLDGDEGFVPHALSAAGGTPLPKRRHFPGERLVALGCRGARLCVVTLGDDRVVRRRGLGDLRRVTVLELPPTATTDGWRSGRPGVWVELPWGEAFSAPDGTLWQVESEGRLRLRSEKVSAVHTAHGVLLWAKRAGPGERSIRAVGNTGSEEWQQAIPLDGWDELRAFFHEQGASPFGLVAASTVPGRWILRTGSQQTELAVPPGITVHGLLAARAGQPQPALVVEVFPDRRALQALRPGGSEVLVRLDEDLVDVAVAPLGDRAAVLLEDGRVELYALGTGERVAVLRRGHPVVR